MLTGGPHIIAKFFRHYVLAVATLAMVVSGSLGAAHASVPVGCHTPTAGVRKMTHALWVILRQDIKAHYAPARRAGIWRRLWK